MIQMLPSLSASQSWRYESITFGSPHPLTILPSGSNSITIGAGGPPVKFEAALPVKLSGRLSMNTWSRASTHIPPTSPTTAPSGKGNFGQDESNSYLGTVSCACTEGKRASAANVAAIRIEHWELSIGQIPPNYVVNERCCIL